MGFKATTIYVAVDVLAAQKRGGLSCQLLHRVASRSRHRLIGSNIDALDSDCIVNGLQSHDHLYRRTVWIGDDITRGIVRHRARIDFRDYQRNIVVVAKL